MSSRIPLKTVKDQIIKALRIATGAKEINLEFPENEAFGDYSSNIAMILAKRKGNFLENIEWFWKNVKKNNYSKYYDYSLPVGKFSTGEIVGLRGSTFAKIRGFRERFEGHPEITRKYFWALSYVLYAPEHFIRIKKYKNRYLLVGHLTKQFAVVVEVDIEKTRNWIVSVFMVKDRYLRSREKDCLKHKKMGKPAGTAVSPILAPTSHKATRDGGSRFSTLQDTQDFYIKLGEESQGGFSLEYELRRNPNDLAQEIVKKIKVAGLPAEAEATAGFINFRLKSDALINNLIGIERSKENFGRSDLLKGKKYLVEHTSPNPNKALHLGHLRNNVTAMAIANLFEFIDAEVVRDCVDNNRGIAIAKLMWGYLKFARKDGKQSSDLDDWFIHQEEWQTPADLGVRPDRFVDKFYVKGAEDFENPEIEPKVRQLVVDWEAEEEKTWALWKKVLQYSYQGQELTLKRLGNKWDKVWHEHEHYRLGKKLVENGLKKGVFKVGKGGAIVTSLAKYKIPDTVVIKSDGTALYITQDLALTKLKKETFEPDKLFWVIGPEQSLALKQVFAVCEQLGIVKYGNCLHLAYGYMSIKGKGKMSSRQGTVVYIDELLDEVKRKIIEKYQSEDLLAEKIAVGAVKYSVLKVGRLQDIAFDIDESISLEGNSGPYLQYTVARINSVLAKSERVKELKSVSFNHEEELVLRQLVHFPEIVESAAKSYSPNLLCNYLYDLASKFNSFYNKHRIIGSVNSELRTMLTAAVGQILKTGLKLLGIQAPEQM